MNLLRTVLVLTAGLPFVAACGTTITYSNLNPPPHEMKSRPGHQVVMFVGKRPERAFIEVGLLEAQQSSGYSLDNREAVLAKLRDDAGERGCDGLIVTGKEDSVVGSTSNGNGSVITLKGYQATCIVWDDSAKADEAAPSPKKKTSAKEASETE